jgi:hypothetical protein
MYLKNRKIKSKFIIIMSKIANYLGFTPKSYGNIVFPSGTLLFNPEKNELTNIPYKPNVSESTLANDSFQVSLTAATIPQNVQVQSGAGKKEYYLDKIGNLKMNNLNNLNNFNSKSKNLFLAFKNILRKFSNENSDFFKNKKRISMKIKEKNSNNLFIFKLFKP